MRLFLKKHKVFLLKLLAAFSLSGIATFVVSMFSMWGLWMFFYELRLNLVPTSQTSGEIVIVDIPPTGADYSYDTNRNEYVSLQTHIELIEKIQKFSPSTIIYTFFIPRFEKAVGFESFRSKLLTLKNVIFTHDDPHHSERMNLFEDNPKYKEFNFFYYPFTRDIMVYNQDDYSRKALWEHDNTLGVHSYKTILKKKYPDITSPSGMMEFGSNRKGGLYFIRPRNKDIYKRINYTDVLNSSLSPTDFENKFVIISYDKMNELRYTKKIIKPLFKSNAAAFITNEYLIALSLDSGILQDHPKIPSQSFNWTLNYILILLIFLIILFVRPILGIGLLAVYTPVLIILGTLTFASTTWMIDIARPIATCATIMFFAIPYLFIKQIKLKDQEILENKLALTEAKVTAKSAKADLSFRLATQVAHDLRAPITVLKTIKSLSQESLKPEMHDMLAKAIDRIESVGGKLLSQFRGGSFELSNKASPENLNLILKDLIESLKVAYKDVQFILNLPEKDCFISSDKSDIERALTNLIINSVEAMNFSGKCILQLKQNDQTIQLTIEDNGAGIPKEIQNKIFEQGFTYGKKSGSGIGLTQAAEVIRKMNGKIQVQSSQPGKTVFEILIPTSTEHIESLTVTDKIIVVEDVDDVRFIWGSLLKDQNAIILPSYAEFQTYLQKNKKDLLKSKVTLITDLVFQGEDQTGFDVIEDLKNQLNDQLTYIYICTSLSENADILVLAEKLGAKVIGKEHLDKIKINKA